jgi:hypothetical protein
MACLALFLFMKFWGPLNTLLISISHLSWVEFRSIQYRRSLGLPNDYESWSQRARRPRRIGSSAGPAFIHTSISTTTTVDPPGCSRRKPSPGGARWVKNAEAVGQQLLRQGTLLVNRLGADSSASKEERLPFLNAEGERVEYQMNWFADRSREEAVQGLK